MNYIKTILPTLLIATCAVLVFVFFAHIPQPVQQALPVLPYLLFAAVLLMALYFNLSGLFYFSLASFCCWFLLDQGLLLDSMAANITLIAALLTVLFIGLLAEKGLLTFAAWLSHVVILFMVLASYGLWLRQPPWMAAWVDPPVLPFTWFNWTPLSQTVWIVMLTSMAILGAVFVLLEKRQAYHAMVTSLALVLLFQWADNPLALNLTCSAVCLALLFGTLQKSWHLAYVDELTALPGRRALEERLQRSLGIYALAMVDIDHFKKFNDSYGHDVGDDVLRMIATKIGEVGGGGTAYRYGGEEFTIVFSNHSADEIKTHLQTLIQAIADTPFVVNRRKNQKPKSVQVTISIGLSDSIHKANAAETIKTADQALYTAKKKGRNRLQLKR